LFWEDPVIAILWIQKGWEEDIRMSFWCMTGKAKLAGEMGARGG